MRPDSWTSSVLGYSAADIAHRGDPANRLVIAYDTPYGIVDLKFRCIACEGKCEGHPRYLYAAGTSHRLWNVRALVDNEGLVVVTEGELDALIVQQHCEIPAVSYPGASAWKQFFSRAFAGLDEVIVVADGDEPGREAAKTIASEIGRFADRARIVRMPDGEDANSYFLAHGATALKELLSE